MQLEASYRLDCLLKWWPANLRLMLVESLEHAARAKNDLPMLQKVTAWRLRAQMAEQAPQEPDLCITAALERGHVRTKS